MLKSIFTVATLLALSAALPTGQGPVISGRDLNAPSVGTASIEMRDVSVKRSTSPDIEARACASYSMEIPEAGDNDTGGAGVKLTNGDSAARTYFVYENMCENHPPKYITIQPGQTRFVSLPPMFQGRIMRGVKEVMLDGQGHALGTWLEFTLDGQGWLWFDVSVIQGCDGAVSAKGLDDAGQELGFSEWILDSAPSDAYAQKASGAWVLKNTQYDGPNLLSVVVNFLTTLVDPQKTYVADSLGQPNVPSFNGRVEATFHRGRP